MIRIAVAMNRQQFRAAGQIGDAQGAMGRGMRAAAPGVGGTVLTACTVSSAQPIHTVLPAGRFPGQYPGAEPGAPVLYQRWSFSTA